MIQQNVSKTVYIKDNKEMNVSMQDGSRNTNFLGIALYQPSDHEEYMCQGMKEHFLSILNTWRKTLMEDVDITVKNLQETSSFADPIDQASDEEERTIELRTRDRERKLISKIDKTLVRILENDYGYCDDCGSEIGLRRLEARPTASECIDCKTFDEQRERIEGG